MEKFFSRTGKVGGFFLGAGLIFSKFVFTVDGGERAIVFDKFRGLQEKVYGEGMHFMIPIIQEPRYFQIRAQFQTIHS